MISLFLKSFGKDAVTRSVLFRILAEKGTEAMFSIGERICYPMHGIGEITGIEQRTVLGVDAEYYVLKFDFGRVSAMVPVATAEKIGLRRLISREEGESVMRYIISGVANTEPAPSANWNRRYRENCDRLKSGSIYAIADVYICLAVRQREKGLSAGEKKMLSLTRRLLSDELTSIGCARDAVISAIS